MSDGFPELRLSPSPSFGDPKALHGLITKRVLAFVLDVLLMGLVLGIVYFVLIIAGLMSLGLFWLFIPLASPAVLIAYPTLYLCRPAYATPGMRVMGIALIRQNGAQPPDLTVALVRTILFGVITGGTFGLALIYALFDPYRRCLHDVFSQTLVVKR